VLVIGSGVTIIGSEVVGGALSLRLVVVGFVVLVLGVLTLGLGVLKALEAGEIERERRVLALISLNVVLEVFTPLLLIGVGVGLGVGVGVDVELIRLRLELLGLASLIF